MRLWPQSIFSLFLLRRASRGSLGPEVFRDAILPGSLLNGLAQ